MPNDSSPVMVVEDEDVLLKVVTKKLEITGKKVISCISGKEALDYLNNNGELPGVIWLDYYLKDMNGLEFMYELKKNQAWANIPVLVVSNSASTEKVTKMLALGAKKYRLKAESKLDDLVNEVNGIMLGEGGGA
jgi:CheY-like chemotaxis protein